ncbi:MAG: hydantoinase/oxoprolinase family protein [Candidatus Hydrothermarchaeales archaeon]
MKVLAFDIGGANTKKLVYDGEIKKSEIHYFPLWKKKDNLALLLSRLKEDADLVAITMTAELCDVFSNKEEGVRYLVLKCEEVFDEPYYLSLDKGLLKAKDIENLRELAAANWLASLYYLEEVFGEGILLDVGSSSTDIIPFSRGFKKYVKSDLERLKRKQLLYTGVLRTPLNAIVNEVPLGGDMMGISSEYFAITADIYNILDLGIDYTCETPDGAGKSMEESMARIARLLCADLSELDKRDIIKICEHIHNKQVKDIGKVLQTVVGEGSSKVYVGGIGREVGIKACKVCGFDFKDLSTVTQAYDNLPCLGLAYMSSVRKVDNV